MEAIVKAKKIGGSIGIVLPKELVKKERILPEDNVKINVEKTGDLNFLWGRFKDIKKPADDIMKEIDEGEFDD